LLITGSADAAFTVLLAHGAGAPMDSDAMEAAAAALVEAGFQVVRFEFAYMAARRISGIRKPPPRAETLKQDYLDAVAAVGGSRRLIIGGKSMGGRVASMVADALHAEKAIAGLLCLGYPFHPPESRKTCAPPI
jgi:predicted alpha/beta-hydrolase family hydrolase